jgi:YrbI family 3-deoxy-D-manno-octulosonate 8-phosphate phosphatase
MMVDVTVVYAVIPARGGSKGIPAKNLQMVGGRSLVARAVDAARRATTVDRVFVSTDDERIAEAALAAGAEVVSRPSDLGRDDSSSESVLLHALDDFAARGLPEPDVLVMLQCTSPFVTAADVDGTVNALERHHADSAFTAVPSHAFLWHGDADGATGANHDASTRLRRQDRAPEYLETGAVYAMRTPGFRAAQHRFFGRITFHEVPRLRALEIDDPADLVVARALAGAIDAEEAAGRLPRRVAALVLDFDGVLTDNRVMTSQDGTESVVGNRSDGLGIEMLRNAGVQVAVLSKERNPVVEARCRKLGVECVQGLDDKQAALKQYLAEHALDPAEVVFVGNDANDAECLALVACGAIVADAHPSVRAVADLVLTRAGGDGAVREMADLILTRVEGSP